MFGFPTRVGVNRIIPQRDVCSFRFPHTRGGEPCYGNGGG